MDGTDGRYLAPEVPAGPMGREVRRAGQAAFLSDVRWAKATTLAE